MKKVNKFLENEILRRLLIEAPEDEEETEEGTEEDEEENDEGVEEEAEEDKEEADPASSSQDSLDAEIEAVFIDFETQARKVSQKESANRSIRALYEQDKSDEIDVQVFSGEVARLVKNYENLIDMESLLVSKAKDFIQSRYGEEASRALVDDLSSTHNIDIEDPQKLQTQLDVPLALGASPSEA